MPSWNELFLDKKNILDFPQNEVHKFLKKIMDEFGINSEEYESLKNLKIWDQCCGAGRHVIYMAKRNINVYGSDVSENGIAYLRKRLSEEKFHAEVKVADMTGKIWNNEMFHGVIFWDALHYNTLDNIKIAVNNIYDSLIKGGMFLVNLLSSKSGGYGIGTEIEKDTFVNSTGLESGVPHHYFDMSQIRELFSGWEFLILSEQVNDYIETEYEFYKSNPFGYSKWNLLLKKN